MNLGDFIVIPIMISAILAFVCLIVFLASPRIFARRWKRALCIVGLGVYVVTLLLHAFELTKLGDMTIYVTIGYFAGWCARIIPLVILLALIDTLERVRSDLPLKAAPWTKIAI